MWNDFKKRYLVVNTLNIHQLKVAIANCQQASLDVRKFYLKWTNLRNKLHNHAKVPVCACKRCSREV